MNYRDALEASKGCPKCCSKTLERFKKNTVVPTNEPAAEADKPVKKAETDMPKPIAAKIKKR